MLKKERRKGENFFRTGVYATRQEYIEIMKKRRIADAAPVKKIPNYEELGMEQTFKKQCWRELEETIHHFARRHGLPEIVGMYGLSVPNNMNDKAEFVCSLDVQEISDTAAPNKKLFVEGGIAGGSAVVDEAAAKRRYQYEMRKAQNAALRQEYRHGENPSGLIMP